MPARLRPYVFQKGRSGNPGGIPKKPVSEAIGIMLGTEITERIAKAFGIPEPLIGMTFREAISLGQGAAGIMGKTEAAKEIADRVEGKVESSIKVKTESESETILAEIWRRKMAALGGDPAPMLGSDRVIDTTAIAEGLGEDEEDDNGNGNGNDGGG